MSTPLSAEVARNLAPVIDRLLHEEPVLVLSGARTVGKSTLLRACAARAGVVVHDLDDPDIRKAVAADPVLFVRDSPSPVCIDEFQHEPIVLEAIKAELNKDLRPGRYLLTGSTRYNSLPVASQSLAGRVHVLTMWPLSQGELAGHREAFLDAWFRGPDDLVHSSNGAAAELTTTRQGYEQIVLAGGFPIPLRRPTPAARSRWYADFIRTVIERDVLEIRRVRQRHVLPEILRRLSGQTAQVLNAAAVASALELDKKTVGDFIGLLEAVHLIHRLPTFGRTLSARVGANPKVHVVDSGLAAHLLGITAAKLAARAPSTLTEFGHLLETFAVNEILKQAGWAEIPVAFSHLRTKDNHEVDLVVETFDGRVAGIEIKASGRVPTAEFRGLRLLRDRLGKDFAGGVVLYLGQRAYTAEDRLHVLPLQRIWAP